MRQQVLARTSYFPILGTRILIFGVCLALLIKHVIFIKNYSTNIYWYDQWNFIDPIVNGKGLIEQFRWQNGAHRMGLGIWMLNGLTPFIHWNVIYESYLTLGLIAISAILALRLKAKLFGHLTWSDIYIPACVMTINQWASYVESLTFSLSSLPVLLFFIFCNFVLTQDSLVKYFVILFLGLLMTYTGYGLFGGICVNLYFLLKTIQSYSIHRANFKSSDNAKKLLKSGWFKTSFMFLLSVIFIGTFFIGYQPRPDVGCFNFPHPRPWEYLEYIALMFGRFFSFRKASLFSTFLSVSFFIFYIYGLIYSFRKAYREKKEGIYTVVALLFLFSGMFAASSAIGRVCVGVGAGKVSRYVPYMIPAFIGFYLLCIRNRILSVRGRRFQKGLIGVLIALAVFGSFNVHPIDLQIAREYKYSKDKWKECYHLRKNISYCNDKTHFALHPNPEEVKLQKKLEYVELNHLNLFAD